MLTEIGGKAGNLCESAKQGKIRCPLIVRSTSEDVVTANLWGTLKVLNPRWWLPDLLNSALGAERFRRQIFRDFKVELWQKQRSYPRQHLRWKEGLTEVDVVLTWENPPTTVFIEMKYGSKLSTRTSQNEGTEIYPADQLNRNARVGLRECGWFQEDLLFYAAPRDFVLLLITPSSFNPLVARYRDPDRLRRSIPDGHRLKQLPKAPFIGELSYSDIVNLLVRQRRLLTRTERALIDNLTNYLNFKLEQLAERRNAEPD